MKSLIIYNLVAIEIKRSAVFKRNKDNPSDVFSKLGVCGEQMVT